MTNIEEADIRKELKQILVEALTHTTTSYRDYMQGHMNETQKAAFLENHKAGKVALSNIETLMKLAHAADIPDREGDGMELAILLQQASAELDKFEDGRAGDE